MKPSVRTGLVPLLSLPLTSLLLISLLLSACGWIPLPEQRGNDFYFTNSTVRATPGQVVYTFDNQFRLLSGALPPLPYRHVSVDARLYARSSAGLPVRLQFFVAATRPECRQVAATLAGFNPALVCEGPASGQPVGETVLLAGAGGDIHLEGPVLEQALNSRTLYLGVRVLEGRPTDNQIIDVTHIRLRARL
jgi:hypothetical protein